MHNNRSGLALIANVQQASSGITQYHLKPAPRHRVRRRFSLGDMALGGTKLPTQGSALCVLSEIFRIPGLKHETVGGFRQSVIYSLLCLF